MHDNHDQLVFAVALALRHRREALLISHSELARRSGLHRSYIGDFERGSRNISIKNVSRLAFALEMPASKVLVLAEKIIAREGPFKLDKKKKLGQAKRK
jgi:transcriptional regulator with XRE-family HTH domain